MTQHMQTLFLKKIEGYYSSWGYFPFPGPFPGQWLRVKTLRECGPPPVGSQLHVFFCRSQNWLIQLILKVAATMSFHVVVVWCFSNKSCGNLRIPKDALCHSEELGAGHWCMPMLGRPGSEGSFQTIHFSHRAHDPQQNPPQKYGKVWIRMKQWIRMDKGQSVV